MQRKIVPAWRQGFTLIELLVVIGILGILMAVVIIAVNPARQFAAARDTQRRSDISAISSAIYQYAIDHNGNRPMAGTPPAPVITTTPIDAASLRDFLVPDYIAAIPKDPTTGTDTVTQYTVMLDENQRIVASASSEQTQGSWITISR